MDIRNFITFNRVVEKESFTKAAISLNYAQSTVSLHIQELEQHYNEPVFDRIGRKITMTAFGQDLHDETLELENCYNRILNLKEIGEPIRTLRIGGYESIMKYRLFDLVRQYSNLYPDVNLEIYYGDCAELRQMVRNGQLDVAFQLEGERNFSQLTCIPLGVEPLCFILPPGKNLDQIRLENTPVFHTEKVCAYRKEFEAYMDKEKITPRSVTETSSVDLIKQYTSFGMGYSLIPEITIGEERDRLTVIPFEAETPLYSQLFYHKDKYIPKEMRDFIHVVKEISKTWV